MASVYKRQAAATKNLTRNFFLGAVAVAIVIAWVASLSKVGGSVSHDPAYDPSIPQPWLQDMAKTYAGPSLPLKDPDSAIYTDTTYRTRHGNAFICGFVNAKNSFGGYAGAEAFIIGGGATMMERITPAKRFKRQWQDKCVMTDASEPATPHVPAHPTPTTVSDQKATNDVRPLMKLAPTDTAAFSRTTYRTRYGMPITCGYVAINGDQPVAYIVAMGSVSRADAADESARKFFPNSWRELCTTTDAMQDREDGVVAPRHKRR